MKKVKRVVVLALVMSLLVSMLCIAPISAASTLEFQGTTTTLFDQSFGGLSEMPSAFTNTGTWTHTPKYSVALGNTSAQIMTKNAYDASAGEGYIFKVGASYSINGFIMYLGWDDATSTGYQIGMHKNKMYLYKDAAFSTGDLENHASCVAVSQQYPGSNAYYGLRRYYTVTVTDDGVTVSSDRDANMITYKLPEGETVSRNGKFGVKSQYTTDFAVWYMTLETIDSNINVNRWMVDKTFTSSDTAESVAAEGFVFGNTPTFNSDGAVVGSKNPLTYDYTALSGDYVFETSVYKQYNSNHIIFNQTDSSNYYQFSYGAKGGYTLTKYAGGVSYVLAEGADGDSYVAAGNVTDYALRVENDDTTGDLKIKITLSRSPYTVEATDYYDDADETVSNGAPITSGKVMLNFDTTGDGTYIKNFKAYSLVDESDRQESIMYEETVFDKTFTASDTVSDLSSKGLTFSGTPTFSDSGININGQTATFDGDLEGTYSFNISAYRKYNDSTIKFGIQNDSNYYSLRIGYSSSALKYFKLSKFVNGTEYVLDTKDVGSDGANYGYDNTTAYFVSVSKDADTGDVTINAAITPSGKTTNTLSAVDYAADGSETEANGAPYTGGKFSIYSGYTDPLLKSLNVKKMVSDSDTNGEIPVFKGRFYNGENAIKEMAKGEIYFGYPTKLLGDYTVLACLYDNNEMVDITVLDELDIYKDKVRLFDTTSVSDDAYIKVYFIDSLGRMNYLSDVYTLN